MVKNQSLAICGLCQLVCSLVLVGIVSKDYNVILSKSYTRDDYLRKINAFGTIIVALVVLCNGIMGLFTVMCGTVTRISYMLGGTVAGCFCSLLVFGAAVRVYNCGYMGEYYCNRMYTNEQRYINTAVLVFACLCSGFSLAGITIVAISTCSQLTPGSGRVVAL